MSGICLFPCPDKFWHKAFLKQQLDPGRSVRGQQCKKSLALSVFPTVTRQAPSNELAPAEKDKRLVRKAPWGLGMTTLTNE